MDFNSRQQSQDKSAAFWKAENWKWSWVFSALAVLLAINLLGPQGILHYLKLTQKSAQYDMEIQRLDRESEILLEEIFLLSTNKAHQNRVVREQLGVLAPHEFRVDFVGQPNASSR